MKRVLAALALLGCIAVLPVGSAHADCDTPGDFGAGSGCPPPGSDSSGGGGSSTESWPPTSVDWPPQFDSVLGDSEKSKAPPIVMPDGMASPPAADAPKPIVGAGSGPEVTTTPTPIVMPGR